MIEEVKVIFIAYNRPEYFSKCLDSVKDQITGMDIHLMLDGPKPWQYPHLEQFGVGEDRRRIEENERLFRKAFSQYSDLDSRIHKESVNLGCQRNVFKARKFPFEELKANYAFFIIEDAEFSPIYVDQLKILFDFCKGDDDIVIMSCGGIQSAGDQVIFSSKGKIIKQHGMIGSIWKRAAYDLLKPHIAQYLDLFTQNGGDSFNFRRQLKSYFDSIGMPLPNNSGFGEDALITHTLYRNKKMRVTTSGCYVRHIGEFGDHCNSKIFVKFEFVTEILKNLYIDKSEWVF